MSVANVTSTVTVNAAFLQEIKEVNQELYQSLAEVRKLCAHPVGIAAHGRRLVEMLEDFRDQLALHFALEEAYGYFDNPASVDPRYGEQAEELRGEHSELYRRICEVLEFAERLCDRQKPESMAQQVARRWDTFDHQFQQHEAAEQELIMQVVDDDVGVGD